MNAKLILGLVVVLAATFTVSNALVDLEGLVKNVLGPLTIIKDLVPTLKALLACVASAIDPLGKLIEAVTTLLGSATIILNALLSLGINSILNNVLGGLLG